MSKKHPGTRYVIVRNVAQYPAVADTWTVVDFPTHENISHHESESEALAAVKRYKQADQRRARAHPLDGPRDAAVALIKQIADRAVDVYAKCDIRADRTTIVMDLMACHFNGQKLRLDDLLMADNLNLIHDVGGINAHLDRETYQLRDGFSPRYAQRAAFWGAYLVSTSTPGISAGQWLTTAPNPLSRSFGTFDAGPRGWRLHAVRATAETKFDQIKGQSALCGLIPRHGWGLDMFVTDRCKRCAAKMRKE